MTPRWVSNVPNDKPPYHSQSVRLFSENPMCHVVLLESFVIVDAMKLRRPYVLLIVSIVWCALVVALAYAVEERSEKRSR